MSKYTYGCEVICNENDVYPAMKELVETEGMSVRAAAKFVERDSKYKVTAERARNVYRKRSGGSDDPLPSNKNSDLAADKAIKPDISEDVSEDKDINTQVLRMAGAIKKKRKEKQIETAKKEIEEEYQSEVGMPVIYLRDHAAHTEKYDLLITDPPYMTDVEDISVFAEWLPLKLSLVKETGFAFVFIGAYPAELRAYLNIAMPDQVLSWTYKNTLGKNPKDRYKLNWQAILFYRMPGAPPLNCPLTSEQWSVQEINAPDGRQGGRHHAWQKPIDLADRLIRHTTTKDSLVFDPFAGTGTFLLAAAGLGRPAVGYEVDPEMVDIAEKRGCQVG